jgi:hypothetical protein
VRWVAFNDDPAADLSLEELAGQVTVLLVADVFFRDPLEVARAVQRVRDAELHK